MEDKLQKLRHFDLGPSSSEYNELVNLLVSRNKVLEEIRYECDTSREKEIPVNKLRKILQGT